MSKKSRNGDPEKPDEPDVPEEPTGDPQSGEGTPAGQYDPAPEPKSARAARSASRHGENFVGGAQHLVEPGFGDETFTTLAGDTINAAFVPAGMEVAPQAIAPGTWPSPIDTFRQQVAGIALVGLIPVGDEKTPYPTGASLAAGKKFWMQQGYYKSAVPT